MFLSLSLSLPQCCPFSCFFYLLISQAGWNRCSLNDIYLASVPVWVSLRLVCLGLSGPKRPQQMCYSSQAAQTAGTGVHCLFFSSAGLAGACWEDGGAVLNSRHAQMHVHP